MIVNQIPLLYQEVEKLRKLKSFSGFFDPFDVEKLRFEFSTICGLAKNHLEQDELRFDEKIPVAQEVYLRVTGFSMQKAMERFKQMQDEGAKVTSLAFEKALFLLQLSMAQGFHQSGAAPLSINMSPWLLQSEDLVETLCLEISKNKALCKQYIELTEYDYLTDAALENLLKLKAAGYQFMLDDIGSEAHADLAYLDMLHKTNAFSFVKLDYQLTRNILRDAPERDNSYLEVFPKEMLIAEGVPRKSHEKDILKLTDSGVRLFQLNDY